MPEDKSAEQVLLEQYNIGDDPEPAPAKPRDPVSGQFVKAQAPARLVGIARSLGISDEEIASSSVAELRETIQDIRLEQQFSQRSEQAQRAVERVPEKLVPLAAPAEEDKIPGEDDIAPQIVSILKDFRKEIKILREENNQLKGHVQARAAESFAQKVDRVFADLGDSYEPFIGRGTKDELDPTSTEMLLRQAVLKDALALAGENASEAKVTSKIKEAALKRFGKLVGSNPKTDKSPKPKSRPADEDSDLIRQWADGGLARPTHRSGVGDDLPKGTARAEAAVADYLETNGRTGGHYEDTTIDEFPE